MIAAKNRAQHDTRSTSDPRSRGWPVTSPVVRWSGASWGWGLWVVSALAGPLLLLEILDIWLVRRRKYTRRQEAWTRPPSRQTDSANQDSDRLEEAQSKPRRTYADGARDVSESALDLDRTLPELVMLLLASFIGASASGIFAFSLTAKVHGAFFVVVLFFVAIPILRWRRREDRRQRYNPWAPGIAAGDGLRALDEEWGRRRFSSWPRAASMGAESIDDREHDTYGRLCRRMVSIGTLWSFHPLRAAAAVLIATAAWAGAINVLNRLQVLELGEVPLWLIAAVACVLSAVGVSLDLWREYVLARVNTARYRIRARRLRAREEFADAPAEDDVAELLRVTRSVDRRLARLEDRLVEGCSGS